jgi:integrase
VGFILMGLHTGMRTGELLELEWARVDLAHGWITLQSHHQKSGKPARVPINHTARGALLSRARFRVAHCPGCLWVFCDRCGVRIASIKKGFAAACQRAGIEDCTPHDLRQTCGSWLVQARVPLREVSKLLRHADIRVTEKVYAHLLPNQLQVTVRVLDRHDLSHVHEEDKDVG